MFFINMGLLCCIFLAETSFIPFEKFKQASGMMYGGCSIFAKLKYYHPNQKFRFSSPCLNVASVKVYINLEYWPMAKTDDF